MAAFLRVAWTIAWAAAIAIAVAGWAEARRGGADRRREPEAGAEGVSRLPLGEFLKCADDAFRRGEYENARRCILAMLVERRTDSRLGALIELAYEFEHGDDGQGSSYSSIRKEWQQLVREVRAGLGPQETVPPMR